MRVRPVFIASHVARSTSPVVHRIHRSLCRYIHPYIHTYTYRSKRFYECMYAYLSEESLKEKSEVSSIWNCAHKSLDRTRLHTYITCIHYIHTLTYIHTVHANVITYRCSDVDSVGRSGIEALQDILHDLHTAAICTVCMNECMYAR